MKKYIKYLSVAAVTVLFASCNKLTPGKTEVEAGFAKPEALPTLTIGDAECDAINGIVNVSVTVSGLPADKENLSLGILTSLTEDFSTNKFIKVENPTEGNVTMQGAITANATYYVKAVAASPKGGASYSNVITVNVPDIPLWAKAPGIYVGTVVSEAYGDKYENTIYVVSDEDDPEHIVWIGGIEAYYANGDYPGKDFDLNYVKATVNEENGCLIVALGEDLHLGGRSVVGLNASSMKEATNYGPISFKMTSTGDLFRAEAFQTIHSNEAEDSYAGNTTYKRK